MSQRDNLTPAKAWAHGVLDDVRAGLDAHSDTTIRAALRALGEPVVSTHAPVKARLARRGKWDSDTTFQPTRP